MNKLKKTFSLRRKRETSEEEVTEDDWQEDELRVRQGRCSFLLQYLGTVEVNDSKGIQICEEALKKLLDTGQGKQKTTVVFQVNGENLKAIDEATSEVILDQAVEKVAFCSPDRNNDRGFAYICRDSAAKKWMCHGFLSIRDQGERVSYAVGYAFNVCMELRMAKEKPNISGQGSEVKRSSSYKFTPLMERRCDPQIGQIAAPIPTKHIENFQSIKRPRAPPELLKRQSSLVGVTDQSREGTFKRQLSMKVEELSTILDRLNAQDPRLKHACNSGDDNLFGNEMNNNETANKNIEPVRQSNPWSSAEKLKKAATNTCNPINVDADNWLLSVAKKAEQLGKQPDTRKFAAQSRTQSVDFAVISAKIERHKTMKGSVNVFSNDWKQSVDFATSISADDPFDIGWAQGLANKGSNPFRMPAPMKT